MKLFPGTGITAPEQETALRKAVSKGSKAEQKTKKKQVEEEIAQLYDQLKENHAKELASVGYNRSNGTEKGNLDTLVKTIAGVSRNPPRVPGGIEKLSRKQPGNNKYKNSRAML